MEKNAQKLYEALMEKSAYTAQGLQNLRRAAGKKSYVKWLQQDTYNRSISAFKGMDNADIRLHTKLTDAGAKYDPKRKFYNAWIESGIPGSVNYGFNRLISPFSQTARENVAYARGAYNAAADTFRQRGLDTSLLGIGRSIKPIQTAQQQPKLPKIEKIKPVKPVNSTPQNPAAPWMGNPMALTKP